MRHPTLLFVPLDDRPVCFDLVVQLASAAGMLVRAPERALLGDRWTAGDVDGLWSWLEREITAGEDHLLIASVEMLCFGGLVASRKSSASFEQIAPMLQRLEQTGRRIPSYVSAVIPRTPQHPTDEDAPHWFTDDRDALRSHRNRQFRVNDTLISAAARGAFQYLLIGQDDTAPGNAGAEERARLQARPDVQEARDVLLTTGADELNARLLARYLRDLTGLSPSVRVVYTYPDAVSQVPRYESIPLERTVEEHVESTGCHLAVEAVDILLWVHNFEGTPLEARDQDAVPASPLQACLREVHDAITQDQVVALADVRFANGADRRLVARLLEEPRFTGIVAYGGWNTCSNTLGSTLAQAVVAFHLRANTVAGNDRLYRPGLLTRILDDWGYQTVVRPHLTDWLAARGGSATELGNLEREAEQRAAQAFHTDTLPRLQASFQFHPMTLREVAFPWHRLFEVRLDLEVTWFGRSGPGGIVVTDYDPAWAVRYEEDRAAIIGALGTMVGGIEHVGSTAVP